MDWTDIVKPYELNYIMGNPPFVGYSMQNEDQKTDIESVFLTADGKKDRHAGKIDYVAGWFYKAAKFIKNSTIKVALVSTNSITQGEQVPFIWKLLFDLFKIHIDFAYKSFIWTNEAKNKASVVCVIIGFSNDQNNSNTKMIFNDDTPILVNQISPYLVDAKPTFIENRTNPLCDVPKIVNGSKPVDGGNLFLTARERQELINKYPRAVEIIKRFYGASEFVNGKERYCIWLYQVDPSIYRSILPVMERIQSVKSFRSASKKKATRESAEFPMLFQQIRQPINDYLIIPRHTAGERKYIPIGFMSKDEIAGDAVLVVPNTTTYEFGIITSIVHMAWTRIVAGRLGNGYRYSAKIVYNNFPWPKVTDAQKQKISKTAQAILDARNIYPDSSLADLYDPLTMPVELRRAHEENDKAVLKAYGLKSSATEQEIVQRLFEMYEELTKTED